MKKRIILWTSILSLCALLTGCTLAQPEFSNTGNGTGDAFCGFWLVYDRLENEDSHVFQVNSDTEQMLLNYMQPASDGSREAVQATKAGSSVGDVALNVKCKDNCDETDIKGTIYLVPNKEDQALQEQGYREVWLNEDVVQAFRDLYINPAKGANAEDVIKPGETVIVYLPQNQINMHGTELKKLAEDAGAALILKSESPRQLKVISVYQRPDGTVYADKSGTRFIMNSSAMSTSQTVENTETINGKTTKKKVTATISVQWVDKLEKVRFVEMSDQNVPLRTSEAAYDDIQAWAKKDKPYSVGKDAAYLILEETYGLGQGGSYTKRTVYDRPQSNDLKKPLHTFHFPLKNGLTQTVCINICF